MSLSDNNQADVVEAFYSYRLKLYVRAVIEFEARPPVVQLMKKTIALNCYWVYNQACRQSHDIKFISNVFFITFDNIFELITKIRFPKNSLEVINKSP